MKVQDNLGRGSELFAGGCMQFSRAHRSSERTALQEVPAGQIADRDSAIYEDNVRSIEYALPLPAIRHHS